MPTSTEFVRLCKSQIALVSSWGASLSVVYLTEKLVEGGDTRLIPVVADPETSQDGEASSEIEILDSTPKLLAASSNTNPLSYTSETTEPTTEGNAGSSKNHPWPKQQIVLPLIHDGIVMGLLVTSREDRPWNKQEQTQIKQIAHTITTACILDQRSQWLKQQFQQQQQLQTEQYDTMHNILHQLKSPLTALRTFGKLLLKRLQLEDKNRDIANSILRESDRLKELLEQIDRTVGVGEEILSIPAQTEYPQPRTNEDIEKLIDTDVETTTKEAKPPLLLPGSNFLELVSVVQVLEPLLISAKAIADERKLDLKIDIPNNLPQVKGNAKALREVLSNLIDNALKYTPAGGKVYIKLATIAPQQNYQNLVKSRIKDKQKTSSMLAIAISDTGYGIPEQDLKHLFERNYRGEKANTNIPGTGLGLAIARDLINTMQGKIQVYSPLKSEWLPNDLENQEMITNNGTTVLVYLQILNQI
ncbi:MAG: GAF domain-containing sensor histidine kinase [Microcoleaceae cyanobacterium MO_207.B10]|nr:GAF domain-containing sensor histidine kinase [Microcoleaceae cyanobacterium MO_207.B10]